MTTPSDEGGPSKSDDLLDSDDSGIIGVVAELPSDGRIPHEMESMTEEERKDMEADLMKGFLANVKEAEKEEKKLWDSIMHLQETMIRRYGYAYALEHCSEKRRASYRLTKNLDLSVGKVFAHYYEYGGYGPRKKVFADACTITEENPKGIPRFAGLECSAQRAHWNVDRLTRMAFHEQYIPTASDCPPTTVSGDEDEDGEESRALTKKKRRKKHRKRNKGVYAEADMSSAEDNGEKSPENAAEPEEKEYTREN